MSFISFRNKHENIWAQIAGVKVWESSKQKLLVVVIDRDYRFIKIIKFNEFSTKKSFVEALFGYCPLLWMFHGREINRKIITYMKDPYTLSLEITTALSRIYLRRIIVPVFTIEISRVLPLNHSK